MYLQDIQTFPVTGENSFWPATLMTERYCTFQSEDMQKEGLKVKNSEICIQH